VAPTSSTRRGEGSQFYAPTTGLMVADFANGPRWEFSARTGYVWSHHGTDGQEATYEGAVDTQVSAQITLRGFEYVSPIAGLVVNVPTGESFLPGQQRFVRMDPDLVELGAYGEGLNVNPTIGFSFAPTANWIVTPSVGYARRGKYDKEGGIVLLNTTPPSALDLTSSKVSTTPGDALTASLTSVGRLGDWTVQGSFAYTSQSDVEMDGVPVGRAGATYFANVAAVYPLAPTASILFNGSWRYAEKNKIQDPASLTAGAPFGGGDLIEEAKNSNSNVLIGAVQPTVLLTDQLSMGVNYSILWRDENYYNIIEDRFYPARTKHSLGLVFDYAPSQTSVISLSGSRFWAADEAGPLQAQTIDPAGNVTNVVVPERAYTGYTGALTAKIQF
jgi:hypothetical protein